MNRIPFMMSNRLKKNVNRDFRLKLVLNSFNLVSHVTVFGSRYDIFWGRDLDRIEVPQPLKNHQPFIGMNLLFKLMFTFQELNIFEQSPFSSLTISMESLFKYSP